MSRHPKPEECDACGWETTDLTETDAYARTQGHGPFTPEEEKEWVWLCNVCRSTLAGNVYLYPRNYSGGLSVIAPTLCWGINAILSAVRGEQPAKDAPDEVPRPTPRELWESAHRENSGDHKAGIDRYLALMDEHGYIERDRPSEPR